MTEAGNGHSGVMAWRAIYTGLLASVGALGVIIYSNVQDTSKVANETAKGVIMIQGDVKALAATVGANGAFYKDRLDGIEHRIDRIDRADRGNSRTP